MATPTPAFPLKNHVRWPADLREGHVSSRCPERITPSAPFIHFKARRRHCGRSSIIRSRFSASTYRRGAVSGEMKRILPAFTVVRSPKHKAGNPIFRNTRAAGSTLKSLPIAMEDSLPAMLTGHTPGPGGKFPGTCHNAGPAIPDPDLDAGGISAKSFISFGLPAVSGRLVAAATH